MLKNRLLITLMILVLAATSLAATTGDPLDTNDQPTTAGVGDACGYAAEYPHCQPCWTTCFYAIMFTAWTDSSWDWNW